MVSSPAYYQLVVIVITYSLITAATITQAWITPLRRLTPTRRCMNRVMTPEIQYQPLPTSHEQLLLAASPYDNQDGDDDDDGDSKPEFARVRRRRPRRREYYDDDDDNDIDDDELNFSSKRSRDDDVDFSLDDDDDEEDDEDDDDDDDDNKYDLWSNTIIPNPLLDAIDPDGAADRFPELARDPRFWIDMVLFIFVLDFLSSAAPLDPFPDIPWF